MAKDNVPKKDDKKDEQSAKTKDNTYTLCNPQRGEQQQQTSQSRSDKFRQLYLYRPIKKIQPNKALRNCNVCQNTCQCQHVNMSKGL